MIVKKHKHYLIKSHDSHKGLIALIITVLIVAVLALFYRMLDLRYISDSDFRIIVVVLLLTLNIVLIIFAILVLHFVIEVKDKYLED
jgi:chromate transport protein ChrA